MPTCWAYIAGPEMGFIFTPWAQKENSEGHLSPFLQERCWCSFWTGRFLSRTLRQTDRRVCMCVYVCVGGGGECVRQEPTRRLEESLQRAESWDLLASQSGDPGVSAADSSSLIWSGSAVLLNRSLNPIRGRQRETEWRASRGRRSFGLAAPEEEKLRAKLSRWQNSVSELLT